MPPSIDAHDQLRTLTRAFLVRFFESEITTGSDDIKGAFFWLLAALAMPGLFIPWLMVFDWHLIGMFQGADALREASRAEKVFYLGFSMIASGMLTAIAWNSLLPDRRDTLILGALPVRPRTVVTSKLAALAAYIALVGVSMHAMAGLFFGAILSTNSSFSFLLRGVAAHFIASCAATASIALGGCGRPGADARRRRPAALHARDRAAPGRPRRAGRAGARHASHHHVVDRPHGSWFRQERTAVDPFDAARLVPRTL